MESGERRRVLRRRYLSLGLGELAAAAVFTYVALGLVAPRLDDDRAVGTLLIALAPLLLVLVQAGAYWLAARSWVLVRPMPRGAAGLYGVFRVVDPFVIAVAAGGVALRQPSSAWTTVFALAVLAFAVVEYVNYYVVRLAYPLTTWFARIGEWRTPRLLQDVRAADR